MAEEEYLQKMVLGTTGYSLAKKQNKQTTKTTTTKTQPKPHTLFKVNTKEITDLNVKHKKSKLPEKIFGIQD